MKNSEGDMKGNLGSGFFGFIFMMKKTWVFSCLNISKRNPVERRVGLTKKRKDKGGFLRKREGEEPNTCVK